MYEWNTWKSRLFFCVRKHKRKQVERKKKMCKTNQNQHTYADIKGCFEHFCFLLSTWVCVSMCTLYRSKAPKIYMSLAKNCGAFMLMRWYIVWTSACTSIAPRSQNMVKQRNNYLTSKTKKISLFHIDTYSGPPAYESCIIFIIFHISTESSVAQWLSESVTHTYLYM